MNPDHKNPTPPVHSLSIEDFKRPPNQMVEYKVGDRVTRENLISFIIFSFRVSRGIPTIQATFLKWIKVKYGFDTGITIANFVKLGGWSVLSKQEQQFAAESFDQVKKHDQIKDEGFDFPQSFMYQMTDIIKPFPLSVDLSKINSFQELTNKLKEEYDFIKYSQKLD